MVDNIIEKEKAIESVERRRVVEEFPTVESPRKSENVEAMSWMEKLERRFGRTPKTAPSDVQDDTSLSHTNTVQSKQPPVTIPLTATQMQANSKADPDVSISWLVIWAKRQITQFMKQNRKVLFAQEKVDNKVA